MKITFLEEAKLEFLDAISYYESEQPGLGQRFKDELDRSLLWLGGTPRGLSIEIRWLPQSKPADLSLLHAICREGNDSVGSGNCSP